MTSGVLVLTTLVVNTRPTPMYTIALDGELLPSRTEYAKRSAPKKYRSGAHTKSRPGGFVIIPPVTLVTTTVDSFSRTFPCLGDEYARILTPGSSASTSFWRAAIRLPDEFWKMAA